MNYNVAVIGVGGIGSHLMDHLNQLCAVGEFANWSFTIFDDDCFESKNLKYQKFLDEQVGMSKAQAVFENCLDMKKLYFEERRATVEEVHNYDIVVICVDNAKWRREFFRAYANTGKKWIDLRSEGRTLAAFTNHRVNTASIMIDTLASAAEEDGSCQLDYELEDGIIQAGNRIVALIGVQYLLNIRHKEISAPSFIQRF